VKYLSRIMSRGAVLTVAAAVILAGPIHAQEAAEGLEASPSQMDGDDADTISATENKRSGAWELGAFIGLLNDEPEYNPDDVPDQYRRDALIGARAGYTFPFGLMLGTQGSNSLARMSMANGDGGMRTRNVNVFLVEAVFGYNFFLSQRFDAFLSAGPGVAICSPDGLDAETDFTLNYGVGGRYFFNNRIGVRGDIRMHQIMDAMGDTRSKILADPGQQDLWALELSVGVSVLLGKNPR